MNKEMKKLLLNAGEVLEEIMKRLEYDRQLYENFSMSEYDDAEEEKTLADTVASAHQQIEEKQYEALLLAKGFTAECIRSYGFAFEGKKVLIG